MPSPAHAHAEQGHRSGSDRCAGDTRVQGPVYTEPPPGWAPLPWLTAAFAFAPSWCDPHPGAAGHPDLLAQPGSGPVGRWREVSLAPAASLSLRLLSCSCPSSSLPARPLAFLDAALNLPSVRPPPVPFLPGLPGCLVACKPLGGSYPAPASYLGPGWAGAVVSVLSRFMVEGDAGGTSF